MTHVVQRVHRLAVARGVSILKPRGHGLVFSRVRVRGLEATAGIEALEDRGVEPGVAVLNHAILVFHPHKHVVWIEVVLSGMRRIRVVTETQRVVALWVSLAVDGLEDVLGVSLEHLLRLFRQLVRVALKLLVQVLVRRGTILGQRRSEHSVAISSRVLGFLLRTGRWEAPVRATTGLEPHLARKDI